VKFTLLFLTKTKLVPLQVSFLVLDPIKKTFVDFFRDSTDSVLLEMHKESEIILEKGDMITSQLRMGLPSK